ncbi:DUF721 domain-containing protein [Methylobacterium nigriterrae]|uniref:DUF721 domain-containing protein n=1 Tax=Methylobacterium nigriterrae TaxID=3127512 RepID=UPI003013A8CA
MARVKPLAELIEACVGPAFAAQGFASTDILAAWPDIVGARLARYCQPSKLEWPRRRRKEPEGRPESGTLVVRVEGVFAIELQHLVPVVIERINAHYGWACVGRIVMQQGRLARPSRRAQAPILDPARRGEVALAVSGIGDEALRDALDRLGTAVVAARPKR